ncbi:radical SAM protein [Candidatus Woesearchaeota archaeon]|nr:radical SAM protein [Candidatus Woesearchaeota archaeon]
MKLYLGLTYDCQLSCLHCGVTDCKRLDVPDLSFDTIKKLFEDLKRTGKFDSVSFFGGEPTLRSDLFDVLSLGKKLFGETTLDSNGLVIDYSYAKRLKEFGLDVLFISLDVFDSIEQDKLRCHGYFENALNVFKICKDLKLKVHASLMVTNSLVESGKFKLYVDKVRHLVDGIRILFPCKVGRNSEILSRKNRIIVESFFEDFVYFEFPGNKTLGCSNGLIYVSPYGDVQLCPYVPVSYGSINDDSILDILEKILADSFSKTVWDSKTCVMSNDYFVSNLPVLDCSSLIDFKQLNKKIMLVNIRTSFNFYEKSYLGYPYSLLKIGGSLKKKGFSVSMVDCMARNFSPVDFVNHLRTTVLPDEIWFSLTFTYSYKNLVEYIYLIRENFPKIKLVLGGIYATLCPEHARSLDVDEVHVGDFEDSSLSWTDLSLLDVPYDYDVLQFSRGCPNRCTYCASSIIADKYITRDYIDIVDEIESKSKQYGIRNFRFIDENILINFKNGFGKVLDEIKKRELNIFVSFWNSSDYRYYDIDVLNSLKNSSFDSRFFLMAYESSNVSTNKKFKRLSFDLPRFLKSLKFAYDNNFVPYANSFVGFPGQRLEDNVRDIVFLSSLGVLVLLSPFTLIPGTDEYTKRLPELMSKKIDLVDLTPCNYLDDNQDPKSFKKLLSFYLANYSLSGVYDVSSNDDIIKLFQDNSNKYSSFLWDCYYYLHKNIFIPELDDLYLNFSNVSNKNSVLDVGCGIGSFSVKLENKFKNVDAVDFSKYAINAAKKLSSLVNFVCSDFLDYESSYTYDLIIDRLSFNSFFDVELYLRKIYSLLSLGGIFKITILENSSFDLSMYNFMLRLPNRYYDITSLKSAFKKFGFDILVEKKLGFGSRYGSFFELKKTSSIIDISGFLNNYSQTFFIDNLLDVVDLKLLNKSIAFDFNDILVRHFRYYVNDSSCLVPVFYRKVFGRNVLGCFIEKKNRSYSLFENEFIDLKADVTDYVVKMRVKPLLVENEFLKSLFWDDSCFDFVSEYYNSPNVSLFLLNLDSFEMDKYGIEYKTKFLHSTANNFLIDTAKFESTYNCNMRCEFCFNKEHFESLNNMDIISIKKMIDILSSKGIKKFTVTGGEPFLRTDLFDIISYAKQKGLVVSLYTNGTLITESHIDFLSKNVSMILVSLHSFDEKEFSKKLNSINLLRKANINLICCTIGSTENLLDLDKYMDFFRDLKVPWLVTRPIPVKGYDNVSSDLILNSVKKIYDYNSKYGTVFRFGCIPYCALKSNVVSSVSTHDVECSAFNSVMVDPVGKVSMCESEEKSKYTVFSNDDFLVDSFNRFYNGTIPEICITCGFFDKCHSGCRYIADKFGKDGLDPLANPKNLTKYWVI